MIGGKKAKQYYFMTRENIIKFNIHKVLKKKKNQKNTQPQSAI